MYASTAKYYGSEGQKSIDPVVFMKLMLVGYLENLNSDRRIISASRTRMDILYFIGYDLEEELPWHSTLSRTRQLYGREQFMALFKLVLKACVSKGLISGKRKAIDSVFVKANAAMSSMVERQVFEDAAAYGKELEANTDQEAQSQNVALGGQQKDQPQPLKPAKRSNKTHVSPSGPDACMSYKPGKVTKLNYLGQVSVDTSNHVITHIQTFYADKGDSQCLGEVLAKTIENLQENSLAVTQVLADAGYSSAVALQALDKYGIQGCIPNAAGYKADRDGFVYDHENDRYVCQQGAALTLKRIRAKDGNTYKVYKTGAKDCRSCCFLASCTNPAGIKVIEDALPKT